MEREVEIMKKLLSVPNVPKFIWSGRENDFNILVMQHLGKDLAYY